MESCNNSINCSTTDDLFYTDDTITIFHALYVMILFAGITGNILTCTVILLRSSMRRSIHLYTFNLSICDLLILLFYVPTQMVYIKDQLVWYMGLAMCKIAYVVLPVSLVCTIGTLLAITIDRTRGLVQPFKWRSDSRRHAKIMVPLIWIFSILLNLPLFIVAKIWYLNGNTPICSEVWSKDKYGTIYWKVMFVLVFVIPLFIITVAHLIMIVVMMKDKSQQHRTHNKRMIRMVIALVVVFSVCTGFQHVYFFLVTYAKLNSNVSGVLFAISNFFVSLQAVLNPIIYGTLRQDFNRAFGSLFVKLMVKLKLQKKKHKFRLHQRLLSFRSTTRTVTSLRSRDSTSTTIQSGYMDSPLASPRVSHVINNENGRHDEPNALLTRANSNYDDILPILRKNVAAKYRGGLPSSLELNLNVYDDFTEQTCDSPVPPTFITEMAFRKVSVFQVDINKRFSKILEFLNESKETDL